MITIKIKILQKLQIVRTPHNNNPAKGDQDVNFSYWIMLNRIWKFLEQQNNLNLLFLNGGDNSYVKIL